MIRLEGLSVRVGDFQLQDISFEAKPGEEITVILTNTGSQPKEVMGHNWILLKAGTDAGAFSTAAVAAKGIRVERVVRVACPAPSAVVFFTVDPAQLTQANIADDPCQVPAAGSDVGSCDRDMLTTWQTLGKVVQISPPAGTPGSMWPRAKSP